MVKAYRPFWIAVHKYIGLVLGVLITIVGVTGSILVYKHEIEGALNPELYYVEPGGEIASLRQMMDAALVAYPEHRAIEFVTNNGRPDGSYHIVLQKRGEPNLVVYINPYTTELLGTRSGRTILDTIRRFHVDLMMRPFGNTLVGLVSIAMLVTFVFGFILWWPSRSTLKRSLTVTWRFGTERFLRDLHNVSGFYLLVIIFLLTISGTAIVFPNATASGLKLIVPGETFSLPFRPQSQTLPDGSSITIDQAMEAARNAAPESEVVGALSPFGPKHFYIVAIAPADSFVRAPRGIVRVDQYSGDILPGPTEISDSRVDRLLNGWIGPIHNGTVLGAAGRLLAFIGGLALPILFGSGTFMWYRRRQRN